MQLQGKTAVITGAASGQGLASARIFAREGARVVLLDRNVEGGEQAALEITETGGDAFFRKIDLADGQAVTAACEAILSEIGTPDILFNNAGIGYSEAGRITMGSIFDTPPEDWDAILRINLTGPYLVTRTLGRAMRDRNAGGSIIFNTSVSALVGVANIDAYTASKGALVSLTRALAAELGESGIRVNAIAPGAIETPMLKPILEQGGMDKKIDAIPLKRLGQPDDIAHLALFLGSDASAYITGQIIASDGGRIAV
tara:strand:- start:11 stop:781 length:771 start_codon:yes stop_codon:yes gene_type:complete